MYSQIQEAEQFCVLHSSVDRLHDLVKWNSIAEPKVLYLESRNNDPYVNAKRYTGF